MLKGLPVSRLVTVSVSLAALAAQANNVNDCLILGGTDVIDTNERIREYGGLEEVGADFSTTDPEYLAATLWFGQMPQPERLYIGRYAQTATEGRLNGGTLTVAQQALANFTGIATGAFHVTIDAGPAGDISGMDFSAVTSMAEVAAVINTALGVEASCVWDTPRSRFVIKSKTTGAASLVSVLSAPGVGVDISALIRGTVATGATTVHGIIAETPLQGVTDLVNVSNAWYAVHFAGLAAPAISDADLMAVSGYVEALDPPRFHAYTSGEVTALDPANTADIFSSMKALGYNKTWGQFSTSSPYAAVSALGRILTTNFNANRSVITLMYKQEPGVVAETLTSSQADALKGKNANVFAAYNNNTNIIQYGAVASGLYFDDIYGADALKGQVQANLYDLLYGSTTKIPQTDAGNQILANGIEKACAQFVANGYLAPGVWDQGGFGQLAQGDFLPKGYYIYAPPVALQSAQDRAARKSVAFQVAGKTAGAIHTASVAITIDR